MLVFKSIFFSYFTPSFLSVTFLGTSPVSNIYAGHVSKNTLKSTIFLFTLNHILLTARAKKKKMLLLSFLHFLKEEKSVMHMRKDVLENDTTLQIGFHKKTLMKSFSLGSMES